VLDLSRFPAARQLSIRDGVPSARGLDLGTVHAWYVRSLPLPLPFLPADRTDYAAGRERRSFVAGFVSGLADAGAVLVNPPATLAQHFRKLEQLDTLRAAGVPVPATLATNDPDAVAAFAGALDGAVVYKPLAGGALCRRLAPADLELERLALLARAPVLFQAEVPGRNLRVYVVAGEEAASYEIRSEALDYRGSETAVVAASLTDEERNACRTAAEACGMTLAGIDVRRRPDGTFAVLECNPSPMFAAIERRTGATPVSAAVAEALLSGAGFEA
jgi:glutathione synthase/RimK-type ligase-like ATP-grasp enzyme